LGNAGEFRVHPFKFCDDYGRITALKASDNILVNQFDITAVGEVMNEVLVFLPLPDRLEYLV